MTVVKGLSNCCFSSNEFITKLPPNSLVSCVFSFIDFNKKANLEICRIVISGWRVVNITNDIAAAQWKHQSCRARRKQAAFSRQRDVPNARPRLDKVWQLPGWVLVELRVQGMAKPASIPLTLVLENQRRPPDRVCASPCCAHHPSQARHQGTGTSSLLPAEPCGLRY